jgi:hypothetical protein
VRALGGVESEQPPLLVPVQGDRTAESVVFSPSPWSSNRAAWPGSSNAAGCHWFDDADAMLAELRGGAPMQPGERVKTAA